MKRLVLTVSSILIFLCVFGQDVNGYWEGSMEKTPLTFNPEKISLEIQLLDDSTVTGISHLYYPKGRYEHFVVSGKFNSKDSTLILTEDSILNYNLKGPSSICFGRYILKLNIQNDKKILTGVWRDKRKGLFHCPSVMVNYFQQKQSKDSTNNYIIKLKRENILQKLIEIKKGETDSIKVELYDNAEIDYDTATILLNDSILIQKEVLGIQPIKLFIHLNPKQQIHKLTLIAENLGNIPPNTALVVVTTKSSKYEIHMNSNFKKNGYIEFFLRDF